MSINKTDLDNHITGHWGEARFEDEEQQYARARRVGVLELMEMLGERDRRIEKLERDVRLIRGFLAHALRLAGDHEDANALDPAYDE